VTFWTKAKTHIKTVSSERLTGTQDHQATLSYLVPPENAAYLRVEFRLVGRGALRIDYVDVVGDWGWGHIDNLVPPAVQGDPVVGNTLEATEGEWHGYAELAAYAWLRCSPRGANCAFIPGAGGWEFDWPDPEYPERYTLTEDDIGSTIRVAVYVYNDSSGSDWVRSEPTGVVTGAPDGQVQLAPNRFFEFDPSLHYQHDGAGTLSWADDQSYSPTHALKLESNAPASVLARAMTATTAVPIDGRPLDVAAWLKTEDVEHGDARLVLTFWSAAKTYISAVDSTTLTGDNAWTQLTLGRTPPAGAAYVRVEFRLRGPGTIWIDDLSVLQ
jgi:hypothetical protein